MKGGQIRPLALRVRVLVIATTAAVSRRAEKKAGRFRRSGQVNAGLYFAVGFGPGEYFGEAIRLGGCEFNCLGECEPEVIGASHLCEPAGEQIITAADGGDHFCEWTDDFALKGSVWRNCNCAFFAPAHQNDRDARRDFSCGLRDFAGGVWYVPTKQLPELVDIRLD